MSPNDQTPTKIEEKIDATLKLVRETQPPATMISRIHQSLEVALDTSRRARQGWSIWIRAAAVVIAIVFAVYFPLHRVGEKRAPAVETAKVAATDSVLPDRTSDPRAASHDRKTPAADVHRNLHRKAHVQYRHVANFFNYPTTEQEKLLIRFAQTASPSDLQALNPEHQAKAEAQQEAEFVAYLKSGSNLKKQRAEDKNQSIKE